jgi:hypothetical protein
MPFAVSVKSGVIVVEFAVDLERPCLPRLEADAILNWLCIDISPIELPAIRRVPASESCSLNEETASWPDVAGVISMASAFFSCGLNMQPSSP